MASRVVRRIQAHFVRLNERSKWSFFWRVWLETTAFAYISANLLQNLFHPPDRTDLNGQTPWVLIWIAVIVGPFCETLIFQFLPLEITARLRLRRFWQFTLSIVPFALAHLIAGIPTVISAGVIAGFYFSFTYVRWKRESLLAGVLMTYLLHSSFNLVGIVGMILLGR